MDAPPDLTAVFPPAGRERWQALVAAVLKGADFEKRLVSRTCDGLRIEPLYDKGGTTPAAPARAARPWLVMQRLDHPDPAAANAMALADLEGGAGGLALVHAGSATARGFGLKATSADALDRALAGVMLDLIQVRLETAPFGGAEIAAAWIELARRRGHDPGSLRLDFGLDPLGDMARTGASPEPWAAMAKNLGETASGLLDAGFAGAVLRADGRPWHEAGASEAQELAAVLAAAVAYLRALEAEGHALETARDALGFLLVADADEFLTIAKFRALRRLWARVEEASALAPKPIRLDGETAWRALTRRDPWVNLLRGTIGAFSAGLGGADSVTVLPFTAALGLPDAFARRLARNTQLILLEEANLWRVADPAAGSGGFEALTDGLCEEAWRLFQEIEREGGLAGSLASGAIQGRVAAVRAERRRSVAHRRDPLTGLSEFPDLREAPVSVLLPSPPEGAGGPRSGPGEGSGIGPLPSIRLAQPFEVLRDGSDEHLRATGARPRAFLANLGPIAAFTARSTFARNALEAGGIEALTNDGFDAAQAAAAAFAASGAPVACLCSSDEIYAERAAETARALKAAGAVRVGLAGRPGDLGEALAAAGVDFFLFAGCDLLSVLGNLFPAAAGADAPQRSTPSRLSPEEVT